jgi:hypothetical protein
MPESSVVVCDFRSVPLWVRLSNVQQVDFDGAGERRTATISIAAHSILVSRDGRSWHVPICGQPGRCSRWLASPGGFAKGWRRDFQGLRPDALGGFSFRTGVAPLRAYGKGVASQGCDRNVSRLGSRIKDDVRDPSSGVWSCFCVGITAVHCPRTSYASACDQRPVCQRFFL